MLKCRNNIIGDLNPSGGALFAIKNVVPTRIKYIPNEVRSTANAMHKPFRRMVWFVHIRTYNLICLWKWSKFVKTANEIARGELQMTDVYVRFRTKQFTRTNGNWVLCTTDISRYYRIIFVSKKTCFILQRSKPFHFPRKNSHVIGMIEIITSIVTHTVTLQLFGYIFQSLRRLDRKSVV